jgi:hypothetical protein
MSTNQSTGAGATTDQPAGQTGTGKGSKAQKDAATTTKGAATGAAAAVAKDQTDDLSEDSSADLRRNYGVFYRTIIAPMNERLSDKPVQFEWEGKPVTALRFLADGTLEVRPLTGGNTQVIDQIQPEHVMTIFKATIKG